MVDLSDCRWIANVDAEALQKHFWDGLVYLNEHLPGLQHIILKTPASVVQVHPLHPRVWRLSNVRFRLSTAAGRITIRIILPQTIPSTSALAHPESVGQYMILQKPGMMEQELESVLWTHGKSRILDQKQQVMDDIIVVIIPRSGSNDGM